MKKLEKSVLHPDLQKVIQSNPQYQELFKRAEVLKGLADRLGCMRVVLLSLREKLYGGHSFQTTGRYCHDSVRHEFCGKGQLIKTKTLGLRTLLFFRKRFVLSRNIMENRLISGKFRTGIETYSSLEGRNHGVFSSNHRVCRSIFES